MISQHIWRKKEKKRGREREMENSERDLIRKHQCAQLLCCIRCYYLIANCHLMKSHNSQTNRHQIGAIHQLEFFSCDLVYSDVNAFVLQLSAPSLLSSMIIMSAWKVTGVSSRHRVCLCVGFAWLRLSLVNICTES